MATCSCGDAAENLKQRRVLLVLLAINGGMFLFELVLGWLADSSGLIADSLDMLADAMVYGIALYAVARSEAAKRRAASLSGLFQVMLAAGVVLDVGRRLVYGSEPESFLVMAVATLAMLANLYCLKLIHRYREGEIHMRASWIFTANDVIANAGVLLAGALVYVLASPWPDLVAGAAIALLVLAGGLRILKSSLGAHAKAE